MQKYTGKLKCSITEDTCEAYLNDNKIAEIGFYVDNNDNKWINSMHVDENYRRKGIASKLMQLAVQEYGEVYASSASKMDEDEYGDDFDTRHLSIEGADFVTSCIKRGILKQEWVLNPYYSYEEDEELEQEFDQDYIEYLIKEGTIK